MFYERRGDLVSLKIKAQPGASRSEFSGLYGDEAIKIRIAAAAVEGLANKELVKFLSKRFKVPKSSIKFRSGKTAKIKILEFPYTEKFELFLGQIEE